MKASETERRIRAAVRVVLSPGVWLLLGAQFFLILSLRYSASGDETLGAGRVLAVALAIAAFLYLVAGVSQALAAERDTVGIRVVLRAGREAFAPFLLLVVKLVLLAGLAVNIVLMFLVAGNSEQAAVSVAPLFDALPLLEGMVRFVFVYWLPIVFVRHRFMLFATLRAALVTGWRRLPQAGYLAFLTLAPAAAIMLLGDSAALASVIIVGVVGGVMEWIAYDYCVQWLRQQPAADLEG